MASLAPPRSLPPPLLLPQPAQANSADSLVQVICDGLDPRGGGSIMGQGQSGSDIVSRPTGQTKE